jgi:hypothetical protein
MSLCPLVCQTTASNKDQENHYLTFEREKLALFQLEQKEKKNCLKISNNFIEERKKGKSLSG